MKPTQGEKQREQNKKTPSLTEVDSDKKQVYQLSVVWYNADEVPKHE
jgi:hypothetical protein